MPPAIFQEPTEAYLAKQAVKELPGFFEEMHAVASERNFPIVGPEVGRVFRQIARLRQPKRILELGSGYGYSGMWWALGAPSDVEIHLTEYKQENLDLAARFAEKAGLSDRFTYHAGDALKTARDLQGPWDIIFCDIDKTSYGEAYELAKGMLRPGDLLLYDNVLWHGALGNSESEWDDTTRHIAQLNDRAYTDPDMEASLLPIRDGILFCVRK